MGTLVQTARRRRWGLTETFEAETVPLRPCLGRHEGIALGQRLDPLGQPGGAQDRRIDHRIVATRSLGRQDLALPIYGPRSSFLVVLGVEDAAVHGLASPIRAQNPAPRADRACVHGRSGILRVDAELRFRRAVVHRHRGESADAEDCWRRILSLHRPDQYCSVDQGVYGHLTWRNLAMLAAGRGDHAQAARLWRAVLAECPGDREALARLERFP
jgi:hypothetical protein